MVCPTQGGDAPLQGNLGSQFIEMFLSPLTVLPSRLLMLDLRGFAMWFDFGILLQLLHSAALTCKFSNVHRAC